MLTDIEMLFISLSKEVVSGKLTDVSVNYSEIFYMLKACLLSERACYLSITTTYFSID